MTAGLFPTECDWTVWTPCVLSAHQPFTKNFTSILLFTSNFFHIFSTTCGLFWGLIFIKQQYFGPNVPHYVYVYDDVQCIWINCIVLMKDQRSLLLLDRLHQTLGVSDFLTLCCLTSKQHCNFQTLPFLWHDQAWGEWVQQILWRLPRKIEHAPSSHSLEDDAIHIWKVHRNAFQRCYWVLQQYPRLKEKYTIQFNSYDRSIV